MPLIVSETPDSPLTDTLLSVTAFGQFTVGVSLISDQMSENGPDCQLNEFLGSFSDLFDVVCRSILHL